MSPRSPGDDRSRTLRDVLAALLVIAVCAAVVATVLAVRNGNEADALQRAIASQRIAAASVAETERSPERAMLLALEAYRRVQHEPLDRSYEARNALLTVLERNERLRAVFPGAAPPSEIAASPDKIALSSDGREFAVATTGGGGHSTIRLWDVARRAEIGQPMRTGSMEARLLFTNGGRTLVAAGYGLLDLFDVRTGARLGKSLDITPFSIQNGKRSYDSEFNAIVVSPSARFVFVAGTSALNMFDVAKRKPLFIGTYDDSPVDACISERLRAVAFVNLYSHTTAVFGPNANLRKPQFRAESVACSPDGRTFAFGTAGGVVLWDVARGIPTKRLRVRGTPHLLAYSPDGRRLAVEVPGGYVVSDLVRHTHTFVRGDGCCVSFSDGGRTLVASDHVRVRKGAYVGEDRAVVWNLERGAAVGPPIEADLAACSTSAPRDACVSVSDDGNVRLWDVGGRDPLERTELPQAGVSSLAFSPDGKTLFTGGDGGDVELWTVPDGRKRGRLRGHAESVSKIAVSRDGRVLGVADGFGVTLWDLRRHTIVGRVGGNDAVAFSPDGRTVATGGSGGIRFWDVDTRRERGKGLDGFLSFSFSPDGKVLASIGEEGIDLWDVDKRARIAQAASLSEVVEFSPTARLLVAAAGTEAIQFWNVRDHDLLPASPLLDVPGYVNVVGFSPDGAVVASGGEDGSVHLWDAARRAQLGDPLYASGKVSEVAVSSRGTVASAGDRVELWDDLLLNRDYDAWRKRICGIVGTNLSRAEWSEFIGSERYHRTCS